METKLTINGRLTVELGFFCGNSGIQMNLKSVHKTQEENHFFFRVKPVLIDHVAFSTNLKKSVKNQTYMIAGHRDRNSTSCRYMALLSVQFNSILIIFPSTFPWHLLQTQEKGFIFP